MDAHRCPGIFQNAGSHRSVLQARRHASIGAGGKIMTGMQTVVVDKIPWVTQACGLSHEIRISADISCDEGVVLVVEILNNKSTYNTLELTSGGRAETGGA